MVEFTRQQKLVIDDERITLEGVDEAGRPVVSGHIGIPARHQTWALTRSGDPASVKGQVRPLTAEQPHERWRVTVNHVVDNQGHHYVATPHALIMIVSMGDLGTSVSVFDHPQSSPMANVLVRDA